MAESNENKVKRLRRRRNAALRVLVPIRLAEKLYTKRVKLFNARLRKLLAPDVPGIQNGWHVKAEKNQVQVGIGAFLNVPAKLVWHTTEGSSLPNPYRPGSHPHFTLNPATGQLWQHIPITSGAMALVHGAVETNRAHAIQVELIGFAKDTPNWPKGHYANIAELARWIEKHGGVARKCSVKFVPVGQTNHFGSSEWLSYSGHCGHQHVPGNDHSDPGAFRVGEVI